MHQLSKSDYMLFLRHPAWLWLKKNDKAKLPPVDDDTQALFDAGHEFELYAEKLFRQGVKLGFNSYDEYLTLPSQTIELIENGTDIIFQGRIEVDNMTCIVDVLQRNPDDSFNLIEIKASTKVKKEHLYDLAFQLLVLEKTGLEIREIIVMYVNGDYVKKGEINPQELVSKKEVTEEVRELMSTTLLQVDMAFEVLFQKKCPDISPRFINQLNISGKTSDWLLEWLKIIQNINGEFDPYSIYNLAYPSPEQLAKLEDQNFTTIDQMKRNQALRDRQAAQIKTTKTGSRIIKVKKIKEFLDCIEYPLYFLDYETLSTLIPAYDNYSPYKDYPFQYSLHSRKKPQGALKHSEYLHDKPTDPVPDLLNQLKKQIGSKGTILTWNMSYEKGCNDRMAKLHPQYADFLKGVNERINDLMIPFSNLWLVDKDFFGSASIKNVLPVLVPELDYTTLNIDNGLFARRIWTETILQGKHADQKDMILRDLCEYCYLDTYAMVRILEELKKLV